MISNNDFRSCNNGDGIGYNLYVFDLRYQKNLESAQTIKVEFKFSERSCWDLWLCFSINE